MNNAERKKRKPSNLVVSIPRNLLHIDVCPELCAPRNLHLYSRTQACLRKQYRIMR